MTKHNKKRNVGLVYELLSRYITECVITDDKKSARKALRIIENYFHKNTELYKEFRLFNALYNTHVSGTHVAVGILAEAKNIARNLDQKRLRNEKSLLIKDINYQLAKKDFYHQKLDEYKIFATIQCLINEWKNNENSDLSTIIKLEKNVITHLITDTENKSKQLNLDENRSDSLVFKLLSEKINEKYNSTLTSEQKNIVRNYAIYHDDNLTLEKYLHDLKLKTNSALTKFGKTTNNKVILSKINEVTTKIKSLASENITDVDIVKYLTVSKLKDELMREE